MARKKEALLQSAEKLVGKGKIEAAIKEYHKVLKLGEDTNTLNLIGDLYGRLRKNDEAIRYYSQAAERYANDGFYVKAIALHKKVHRIEPGRMDAHIRLAELYHRQGLATEARVHYQTLADHYQRQKDAASAIGIYQKMIDLEPNNPTPRAKLAELYKQEHLLNKAVEQYGEIAAVMLQHGQADQALQVYLRALDLDASDVGFVRTGLSRLLEAGALPAAEQFFTTAAQRNSSVEELRPLLHGGTPQPQLDQSFEVAPAPPRQPEVAPVPPRQPEVAPAPPRQPEAAPVLPRQPEAAPALPRQPEVAPVPPPRPEVTTAAPGPAEPMPSEGALPPLSPLDSPAFEDAAGAAPAEPARSVEFEGPSADFDDLLEIELEAPEGLELEVPGASSGSMAAVHPPPPSAPKMAEDLVPEAEPPKAESKEGYEEFVLDLDADEVPSTLVQPPADMLEDTSGFPGDAGAEASGEFEIDLEGSGLEGGPVSAAESQEFTFEPEPELETPTLTPEDVDLELTDSQLQPEVLPSPAEAVSPASPSPPLAPPVAEAAPEVGPPARALDDLLAEAEVFVKYGLSEKAVDRLQEVLAVNPRHLGAHVQLVSLFLGQGDVEQVMNLVPDLARLALEGRTPEPWNETRDKLVEAGYRFEGDTIIATPAGPVAGAEAEAPVAEDRPIELELEPSPPPVELVDAVAPSTEAPREPEFVDVTGLDDGPAVGLAEPMDAFQTFVGETELADLDGRADQGKAPARADADPTSWLDDIQEAPSPGTEGGENLFDDEEEFFDLAAELQDDLKEEEAAPDEPREQTLEEIVEGFKKGVAENLSPEDSDTHYNLGIAYREMMLLDEAIGEFQIAAKDPAYLVDCCAMLGQCFSDKGLPELALKWYRRALDSPSIEETQTLGMLYEVANAFLALDDRDSAYKTFVEIYGMKTNYRDVVARMQELAPARSGS